jgi:predicted permease
MRWWKRLQRRDALDVQLDAELRDHLARQTADLIKTGLSEAEARRQAGAMFGALEAIKEECRDARRTRWVEDGVADVIYACRLLRKSPAFGAVAVLSLALAIGANIAVVSLLDVVVLRTLPVPAPRHLVLLAERAPDRQILSWSRTQFRALAESGTLTGLCAFRPQLDLGVGSTAGADVARGQLVSGNCFDVLGVRAALGRMLTKADDEAGEALPAVVISYGFWKRYFGGDRAAVGSMLRLKDRPFTVVGVTPPEFLGLEPGQPLDVTIPLAHAPLVVGGAVAASPNVRWLRLIGRVRPDVALDQAAADLDRLWRNAPELKSATKGAGNRLEVLPGAHGLNDLRRQFSAPLSILMAGVGLLLLVACANLAALLLARTRSRDHEMRLRIALGAGRGRILRQLLTEACVLSAAGGAAGLGLASSGSRAIVVLLSRGRTAIALPPMIDGWLLIFAFMLTGVTSIAFGVWPALSALRDGSLASAAVRTTTRRGRLRAGALIAVQTTVSALLLTGAVLFWRSLAKLYSVDLGFEKQHVLLARIQPGLAGNDRQQTRALYQELFVRLSGAPAVRSASMAMDLPLGGVSATADASIPGEKACDDQVNYNFVGPRFFETMGIPIMAGRDFAITDDGRSRRVAIASASLAARCFPSGHAVGKHLDGWSQTVEIVGVAKDIPYAGVRDEKERVLYRPYLQDSGVAAGLTFVVRTDLAAAPAGDLVRSVLRGLAPAVPVSSIWTLEAKVDASIPTERLLAHISAFFGAMALLLVAIGVYGTLAYSIAQRTRELGVRVALGATRGDIARTILAGALAPVGAGLLLGVPLTLAVAGVARQFLYGITSRDPAAYAAAIVALLAAALAAALLPIRQAVRGDPIAALREE